MFSIFQATKWPAYGGIALVVLTLVAVIFNNPAYANSRVAITVNNGVVTSYQVAHRARFLKVTGFKGDAQAKAVEELIQEELIFQEARRIKFQIKEPPVNRAFASIAQRLKLSPKQFEAGLRQRGVDPETLKARLRSQLAWRDIVVGRTRASKQRPTKQRDITSILFNRDSNQKNRKLKEVVLEQYIFVVKRGASDAVVKQRIREAETFRRKHASCAAASQNALSLKEVVVKKLGRFTEETLAPGIRQEVLNTDIGNFTKPRRGELGVAVIGVCEERVVVDNSATNTFNAGQLDTKELAQNSDRWLGELKDRADIRKRL